jgi:hypothetical protein
MGVIITIEIIGVSGKPLIMIGIAYIVISKIFLFISWYSLYHKLPDSIAKQDYKAVNYHMTTFRVLALYEVIVTFIYLIIGVAMLSML